MLGYWDIRAESAESLDANLRTFFTTYCVKCHGPDAQEADFRVDRLRVSESVGDAEYWQLVLDNLNLGEMPPEVEKQPAEKEREAVTSWIDAELRRARRVLSGESGEVVLRRLNRTEYEYTIEDLFGVRGDFADGFPADATAESFDNQRCRVDALDRNRSRSTCRLRSRFSVGRSRQGRGPRHCGLLLLYMTSTGNRGNVTGNNLKGD